MSVGQFRRLRARMADRVLSLRPVHSVVLVMALVAGTHLLLSLLPISSHHPSQTELLTGIAYFVLSILLGFTLENVRSGQARVNELLKSVDADMLAIYQLTSVFGDSVQHRFRGLLDVHLQDQIDYFLPDWCKSEPSYIALWRATVMLQPDGTAQEVAYDHLLGQLEVMGSHRKQLESLVRQRVRGPEWLALIGLFAALWLLVLMAGLVPVVLTIIEALMIAALAGLLCVAWLMDRFRWQEVDAIWEPLHRLALALDLVPYYPADVFESGRLDQPPGEVRLARYPNPYPDMTDKVVTLVKPDFVGSDR